MRFLTYPEIFELFAKEILTLDLDEKIFQTTDMGLVVELDHEMKDRMFRGHYIDWKNDVHAQREMDLHACFSKSLMRTVLNNYVVPKGEIVSIPLLEKLQSKDQNILGFLSLTNEAHEAGFRLASPGLVDITKRPLADFELTNVKRTGFVKNDACLATLRLTIP